MLYRDECFLAHRYTSMCYDWGLLNTRLCASDGQFRRHCLICAAVLFCTLQFWANFTKKIHIEIY